MDLWPHPGIGMKGDGLVMRNGKFLFGWRRGYGRRLPHRVLMLIVDIWNPIGCRLFGHNHSLPVGFENDPDRDWSGWRGAWVCGDCCRTFTDHNNTTPGG